MKKFALVLSGGGFKGAFQVGALQYLKQNWNQINPGAREMKFDIVAGVSVGSLNGYMVAANQFDSLQDLWKKVGENGVGEIFTSDIIDTAAQSDHVKMKLDLEKLIRKFLPNLFSSLSMWKMLGANFDQANIGQIASRSLTDVTLSEIFDNDLREFMRINDLIEQTETLYPGVNLFNYNFQNKKRSSTPLRSFNTIVIQPAEGIGRYAGGQ